MSTPPSALPSDTPRSSKQRSVILASSVGTLFEWYDFYLYATLAPFFALLFFPKGNDTAAMLAAFATYAAGFLVRPFGALVFGRLGDMVGRKYTFLVTIVLMGGATFAMGLMPTYASIGWAAPVLLVVLRLVQGLALGGEYGGAATYVAEHASPGRRGADTAWIQTTATLGFLMSLAVIGGCRVWMEAAAFAQWGWRVPFLLSLVLLGFSVYMRLHLNESPDYKKLKEHGHASTAPLRESFLRYPNNLIVLLALVGAAAGQGVVWYTGQFYALFFLTITMKVDFLTAYTLVGAALVLGTPFIVIFGKLSDRIGRLKIIVAGCIIAALTYFPLFKTLTQAVNPDLAAYVQKTRVTVAATNCHLHMFVGPWSRFSECDRARDFLAKQGVSFELLPAERDAGVTTTIGRIEIQGWDEAKYKDALAKSGYPGAPDKSRVDHVTAIAVLFAMMLYVAMVYGPMAAFLVDLFPTRIRYTSMSLPYHIGNGWFGGMLPLVAAALVTMTGDIYGGLWYPIVVALMTAGVGAVGMMKPDRRAGSRVPQTTGIPAMQDVVVPIVRKGR